jgi:polar amino acid transport system substrate-binding protein
MLYRESVVLFCHDAVMQTARAHFPDDFAGLTIGVNTGFTVGKIDGAGPPRRAAARGGQGQ